MAKSRRHIAIALAALAAVVVACSDTPDSSKRLLVIADRAGQDWDVSHAHDVYGMDPAYFNYGLGFGAIPSMDEPTVFSVGDLGYPQPESQAAVFGIDRNGETRAYDVRALTRHEVFNEVYPGESNQYVAVAY